MLRILARTREWLRRIRTSGPVLPIVAPEFVHDENSFRIGTMSQEDFCSWVSGSPAVQAFEIVGISLWESQKSPFYHQFCIATVQSGSLKYNIRLERMGKLDKRWGVGGTAKQQVVLSKFEPLTNIRDSDLILALVEKSDSLCHLTWYLDPRPTFCLGGSLTFIDDEDLKARRRPATLLDLIQYIRAIHFQAPLYDIPAFNCFFFARMTVLMVVSRHYSFDRLVCSMSPDRILRMRGTRKRRLKNWKADEQHYGSQIGGAGFALFLDLIGSIEDEHTVPHSKLRFWLLFFSGVLCAAMFLVDLRPGCVYRRLRPDYIDRPCTSICFRRTLARKLKGCRTQISGQSGPLPPREAQSVLEHHAALFRGRFLPLQLGYLSPFNGLRDPSPLRTPTSSVLRPYGRRRQRCLFCDFFAYNGCDYLPHNTPRLSESHLADVHGEDLPDVFRKIWEQIPFEAT